MYTCKQLESVQAVLCEFSTEKSHDPNLRLLLGSSRSSALIFFWGGEDCCHSRNFAWCNKNPGKFHSKPATIIKKSWSCCRYLDSWVVSFLFCPRPSWRSSRKRNRRLVAETGVMFSCGKTPLGILDARDASWSCNKRVELMDKNPAKIQVRRWFIPTESHESETKKNTPSSKL